MGIGDDDVKRVGEYMKPWLRDMVRDAVHSEAVTVGPQLLERMVRVEEELKAQRELMKERFQFMADRFSFMDRRFEQSQKFMAARFESVDGRFEQIQATMGARFDAVDKRFESVNERFGDMQESFRRTQWLIGLGFVLLTAAVTVFGMLG